MCLPPHRPRQPAPTLLGNSLPPRLQASVDLRALLAASAKPNELYAQQQRCATITLRCRCRRTVAHTSENKLRCARHTHRLTSPTNARITLELCRAANTSRNATLRTRPHTHQQRQPTPITHAHAIHDSQCGPGSVRGGRRRGRRVRRWTLGTAMPDGRTEPRRYRTQASGFRTGPPRPESPVSDAAGCPSWPRNFSRLSPIRCPPSRRRRLGDEAGE
jgi:hypothetical protein